MEIDPTSCAPSPLCKRYQSVQCVQTIMGLEKARRLASHVVPGRTSGNNRGLSIFFRTYEVHMRFIAHTSIMAGMLQTPRMKSAVSYAARLGSEVEPSVCGAFT